MGVKLTTQPPKRTFYSICRPNIFKTDTQSWEKLSKCYCAIYESPKKKWIALNVEGSGVCILNAAISPQSRCLADIPTRVQLHVINASGVPARYVIRFTTADEVNSLVSLFGDLVCESVRNIYDQIKERAIIQPVNKWWNGVDAKKMYLPEVECIVKDISTHQKCFLNVDENKWVLVGPINLKLVVNGPRKGVLVSTRLMITSTYSESLVYLDVELERETCQLKMDRQMLLLRVLVDGRVCDFRMDDDGQVERRLLFEIDEADVMYKAGMEKWGVIMIENGYMEVCVTYLVSWCREGGGN
jgi:hypothetical protein